MSTPSFSSYPDPDSEAKNIDVYHTLHLNWSPSLQQQELYLSHQTLKLNMKKTDDRIAAVLGIIGQISKLVTLSFEKSLSDSRAERRPLLVGSLFLKSS